jgi:rhamnogalacturonan endolyase
MLVADFQLNGSAMLIVKTADGTVDGLGNVIGNATAIHRSERGHVLRGPEFLTLFCGRTGENLHTIDYKPVRGDSCRRWGDPREGNGNRSERHLGAVAYLDGVRPSAVTIRGYYTRMALVAYDVEDNKLVERWVFDTGHNSSHPAYGQGNHNVMPAAVHPNSSRQSIFLGASAIRYDGELLWSSRRGHGDALHVGSFIPDRTESNGIQVFSPFETSPFGIALFDALTGQELWRQTASGDTGRGMAGNFVRANHGAEFWGAGDMRNIAGQRIGNSPDTPSFAIWWDGGLERQLLNNTGSNEGWMRIDRVTNTAGNLERVFTPHARSINGTKANPNLSANILGDWREQLIMRLDDNSALRVFTTVHETQHRITTLMHDPQYRVQVAGQNITYNQPPHPSFYLGTNHPLPPRVPVQVRSDVPPPETCEVCELEPCECPPPCAVCELSPCECPPIITVTNTRHYDRITCTVCEVEKMWFVTQMRTTTNGDEVLTERRAAKRDSDERLLEHC